MARTLMLTEFQCVATKSGVADVGLLKHRERYAWSLNLEE